jgi:hypothetical protein
MLQIRVRSWGALAIVMVALAGEPVGIRILESNASMPKYARHPARLAALAAGEKKWLGPECDKHGEAPHHTSSGQCVACNRERSAIQAVIKSSARQRYVPLAQRPERLAAAARGDAIYWGPPCLNGHAGKRGKLSPRYTSSTRCVACVRAQVSYARQPAEPPARMDVDPRHTPRDNSVPVRQAREVIRRAADKLRALVGSRA